MKPAIEYLCALTVKVTLIPMAFTMVDGLPIENSLKEDIKDKIGWFIETVIDPKTPGDKAALYMQKELVDYDEDISLREVDDIIGLRKTALYRKEERYGALTNKEELEKTMRMFVESLKKKDAIQQLQSKSFALTADDAMEKLKSFGLNAIEKKEKNGTKDIKEASVDKPSVDDITTAEDGKKTVKKTDDGAGNPTTVKKKQDT